MFLQNLKKITNRILIEVEDIFNFYFKEVMIGLSLVGAIILVIVVFISIFAAKCSMDKSTLPKRAMAVSSNNMESKRRAKLDILLENSFLYPKADGIDLSDQYIDFSPTKKLKEISYAPITKEYDKLFQASLDDSLSFDFERKKRGR